MAVTGVNDYVSTYSATGSKRGSNGLSSTAQDYLNDLRQKYSDVNITVADFTSDKQMKGYMLGRSGINNIAISSRTIEQMASNPAVAAKYEKVIADVPKAGKEIKAAVEAAGNEHLASGTIIDKNGKVSYWGVGSKRDDLNSNKVSNREKLQKQLEEKRAKKKEEENAKEKRLERAETLEKLLEKIRAGKADNKSAAKAANKDQAYAVSISREGLEKLKQNTTSNTMGIEKADQYRSILSKAQIDIAGAIEADFHHRYTKLNTETKNGDMKAEDFVKNALSVYADMYDEIKRGYADGTREVYIADGNAEFGYRRATEEEEIAALDAAFDFHASYTEAYMRFVNEDRDAMYAGIQRSQALWQAAREKVESNRQTVNFINFK